MNNNIHVHECNGSSHDSPALLPQHLADLRASGLSDDTIRRCGFHSVITPTQVTRLLRWRGRAKALGACLAIPFTQAPGYVRLKPDNPRRDRRGKAVKYESPVGRPNRAYFPPGTAAVLADPATPLVITEGEKKAAKADQEGFPCIGLVGVYGWQKPRGAAAPRGDRYLIDDLAGVAWRGRAVYVVYDSDAAENPAVWQAALHLAEALADEGADARIAFVPGGVPGADGRAAKAGLDDYLVAHGPDALRAVLAGARRPDELPPPPRSRVAAGTDGAAVMGERLDLDDLDSDAARRVARETAEETERAAAEVRDVAEAIRRRHQGEYCTDPSIVGQKHRTKREFAERFTRCGKCAGCRKHQKRRWTDNIEFRLTRWIDKPATVYVGPVTTREWKRLQERIRYQEGDYFWATIDDGTRLVVSSVPVAGLIETDPAAAADRLVAYVRSHYGAGRMAGSSREWQIPKVERPRCNEWVKVGKGSNLISDDAKDHWAELNGVEVVRAAGDGQPPVRVIRTRVYKFPGWFTRYQRQAFMDGVLLGMAPGGGDIEDATEPIPQRAPDDPEEDGPVWGGSGGSGGGEEFDLALV
jgi:hypothetical protein